MDFIKTNYDDSDHDSEFSCDGHVTFENSRIESDTSHIDLSELETEPQEYTARSELSGGSNFFNINLSERTDNDDLSIATEMTLKQVKVKRGQREDIVEVPNGKFWQNIPINVEVSDAASESVLRDATLPDSVLDSSCNKKRKIDLTCYQSKTDLDYYMCRLNKTSPVVSYQIPSSLPPDVNYKKLFYLHHKISPHVMNRKSTKFQVPKTILTTFQLHHGIINRIKWNVPMFSHLLGSSSMDGTVKVCNPWSIASGPLRTIRSHSKAVKGLDWSSTGRELLSSSYDKTAACSDVEKGITLSVFEHPGYVLCCQYHSGNPNLIITGSLNEVLCWDIRDAQQPIRSFSHKDSVGQVQDVTMTPDCSQLFASTSCISRESTDKNIICWDFSTGVILSNQIYQERYMCTRLKMHPKRNEFLAQSHGDYIAIFSANRPYKMNRMKRFEKHKVTGNSIGFDISPDGQTVISGDNDGHLYLYDYYSSQVVSKLDMGRDHVMDVACHPVLHSTVASCDWSGRVTVWQ